MHLTLRVKNKTTICGHTYTFCQCSLKNCGAKAQISKAYDNSVSKAIFVGQTFLTRNTKSKVARWGKIPKKYKNSLFFFVTSCVSKVTFANVITFLGDHRKATVFSYNL